MVIVFDTLLQGIVTIIGGIILFTIARVYNWMRKVEARLDNIERDLGKKPK